MLISPVAVLVAGVLAAPPATTATSSPPERSSIAIDDVAIPALQLVGDEAVVGLGLYGIDRAEGGLSLAIAAAMPVAIGLTTCAIGRLSVAHRGSCWHSLAGTAAGLAGGFVLYAIFQAAPGANPFPRGSDDSQQFTNAVASAALAVIVLAPAGSIAAWHVGKTAIDDAPPPVATQRAATAAWAASPRQLIVPVVSATF